MIIIKIIYKDKKVERLCTDFGYAKRQLNSKIAVKLFSLINILSDAVNLKEIQMMPSFHLHALSHNRKGSFALDIDGRKSGMRLIIRPEESDKKEMKEGSYLELEIVIILEVTNHYE